MRNILTFVLTTALAASASADIYDPPAGYYSPATGTGSTLKAQLNNIIDGHIIRSYGDARFLLQDTDQDLNDPNRMILVYDNVSLDVSAINPGGSIPGWDSAATWNREHTWPRSRGVGSSGADNSDLHHLRPSFTTTNSNRGSLSFGGAYGQSFGVKFDQGATVWYPGDADAGRIARAEFYMDTRYDGADSNTVDLTLVDSGSPGTNQLGDLSRLLEWHYIAPPDEFERARNQRVYGIQNNRNPFIDHPEYVWSVFVDQQNDSQLSVGGAAAGNGSSSTSVDLGSVYVGAAAPGTQSVTLNKAGNDGTYFAVTTTGGATSSVTGKLNAFAINAASADSRTLDVGLNASTATAGLRSGTVVIDNLDITTAGGAGRGDNDANDTINVSLSVLDHATPSLAAGADLLLDTVDLGIVALGSSAATADVTVYNRETTANFTGDLLLQGATGLGDSAELTLAVPGTTVVGGDSATLTAAIATGALGDFSALWTIDTAEAALVGSTDPADLQVILTGTVAIAGDADLDNFVAQADLDAVLLNWGATGATWQTGDFDRDGFVAQADLDAVLLNWGATAEPNFAGSNVPEPAAMAVWLTLGLTVRRRRCG